MKFNLKKVGFILILVLIMVFIGFVMLTDRKNKELNNELNETINNQNNINQDNVIQNDDNQDNIIQNDDNQEEIYEDKVVVNSVVDATGRISFYEYGEELVAEVINGEVKIGNTIRKINGEKAVSVTGYYYQPGGVTHFYVLTESKKVYVLSYDVLLGIGNREFKVTDVTNVDKLVLYDVEVYAKDIGQVDERNRVYAVIGDTEKQIDSYCVRYNELD